MRDQLPHKPNNVEIGIINLDESSRRSTNGGKGIQCVAYATDPRGIVYFDSYGLAPPKEFLQYSNLAGNIPIWYSTLQTQKITDPPICGREALAVLNAISASSAPSHKSCMRTQVHNTVLTTSKCTMVDIYGRSVKTKTQQTPGEDLFKQVIKQISDELSGLLNLAKVDPGELVFQDREGKLMTSNISINDIIV